MGNVKTIDCQKSQSLSRGVFPALEICFVALFCSTVHASCPHCYEIVKVRAEFIDGTSREAYYELHEEWTPIETQPDGSKTINIARGVQAGDVSADVRLMDSIYHFEGITTATTPEVTRTVPLSALTNLVLLETTPYSGAMPFNTYSRSRIETLRKPPFATFKHDVDPSEVVYVSYDPAIMRGALESLATFIDYLRPSLQLAQMGVKIEDDAWHWLIWQKTFDKWEAAEGETLATYIPLVEHLEGLKGLGALFRPVAQKTRLFNRFRATLRTYRSTGSSDPLLKECRDIMLELGDSTGVSNIPFSGTPESDIESLRKLTALMYEKLKLPDGPSYEDLERYGIIVAVNPFD